MIFKRHGQPRRTECARNHLQIPRIKFAAALEACGSGPQCSFKKSKSLVRQQRPSAPDIRSPRPWKSITFYRTPAPKGKPMPNTATQPSQWLNQVEPRNDKPQFQPAASRGGRAAEMHAQADIGAVDQRGGNGQCEERRRERERLPENSQQAQTAQNGNDQ